MGDTPKGLMIFERKRHSRKQSSQNPQQVRDAHDLKSSFDPNQKELECARAFNFELPEDLVSAVEALEDRVSQLSGTQKNMILILDEESDTYTCINDHKNPDVKPRELTLISDGFIQEMLGSDEVIHTYLYNQNALIGIVAVADKTDGTSFDFIDEITLELMARYLAIKVMGYQNLKTSLSLPFIQSVALEVSNRLIAAVDNETILGGVLESLGNRLGIEVCQYVTLDDNAEDGEVGEGQVLFENIRGNVKSYGSQHRDEKRKVVKEFASLVSLFTSMARRTPYLHLSGKMLGDKALSDLFGVRGIESALILPIMDVSTGKLRGVLNLFKTRAGLITNETLEISKQVCAMVSLALGRASALEKALIMASSDELTGLTNRRGFYDRFEVEVERSRRNPTSLCVAMIDVDHFKKLNDTYGHLNGDLVLQQLATLLLKNVRKSDVVCRFGGEEFALLLPDTPLKAAVDLVDRIRRKVQKMRISGTHGEQLKVTLSAGVAIVHSTHGLVRPSREVISESLSEADAHLYEAKETGRNQVRATNATLSSRQESDLPFLKSECPSP